MLGCKVIHVKDGFNFVKLRIKHAEKCERGVKVVLILMKTTLKRASLLLD